MTRDDEFIGQLESYLDEFEGDTPIPDATRDAIRAELPSIRQRPARWPGWRFPDMNKPAMLAMAVAAVLVVAFLGIRFLGTDLNIGVPGIDDPGVGPPASTDAVDDLGVFEPVRGQIVFRVGNHLEAIDPDGTSTPRVIAPGNLGLGTKAIPAGWSADGSRLAITDEYNGKQYVLDETGSLTRVPTEEVPGLLGGCCWFVSSPWLSPDGAKGLAFGQGRLHVLDLQDVGASRSIPLDGDGFLGAWSPDGSQAAWTPSTTDGGEALSSGVISITDLVSGRSREVTELVGMYIRHITWSPDGSQLLVIAGEDDLPWGASMNPLVGPQPTSLYLIDIGNGESRVIGSSHYVAAAWSPDGMRIAAIDYPLGTRKVVVLNADGSGARRVLAELPAGDDNLFTGVVWHPGPAR